MRLLGSALDAVDLAGAETRVSSEDGVEPCCVGGGRRFRQLCQLHAHTGNQIVIGGESLSVEKVDAQGVESSAWLEESVEDVCSVGGREIGDCGDLGQRHG